MAELVDKLIYEMDWFKRNALDGIECAAQDGKDAAAGLEVWLLRNIFFGLLDAQRAEAGFRHRELIDFFSFCSARLQQSKSQIFQDLWVLFLLGEKRGGFFVEFGACDGLVLSNSALLEASFGWTGILAEPNPVWHSALIANRSAKISTDCVAASSGEIIEFLSADKNPELSRIADIVPDDVHEREGSRAEQTRFNVRTISLNDLLSQYDAPEVIDYLSIDTEGSEYEILKATDFDRWKFRLITVEHAGEEGKRKALHELLKANGYIRWRPELSRWDDWYILPNL